jgi:predicted nucleic acid-binding protein
MTLTDAGPLVALIDRNDSNHARCLETIKRLPKVPLLTTWPALTEAMYLLFRDVGYAGQVALWKLYQSDGLALHDLGIDEIEDMIEWMDKYRDAPMDLADASLMATAEQLNLRRIFTLDSHFRIYRLSDGSVLDRVP